MLRVRVLLLGSAAVLGGVAVAQAADIYTPPPSYTPPPITDPAPAFSWTGPYLGGLIGYGWGNFDNGVDADGFLGGIYGGYNVQSGNFVYGLEADGIWSGQDGVLGGVSGDVNWTASLRSRFGWTFDRHLLYATAGIAVADAELSSGGVSDSNTHLGWTVGAGLETAWTDRVTSRVEYLFADYGSENYSTAPAINTGFDTHTVRVGLGFKF